MFKKHLANKKIVVKKTAKFFKLHLNNFAVFLTLIAIIFTPLNSAFSAFNPEINYQGKLTNASNVAVADGDYNMEFKLYTASSGGTAIWTETLTLTNRVTVTNGLFSVLLGNVTSLSSIDFNQNLYLGVNIGGTPDTPSWDGEMSPRKQIASVPSAFESGKLDGLDSTQFLRSDDADSMASSSASTLLSLVQSGIGNILSLFDGATEVFTVKDGGNIGIGTTSPLSKLSVEGNSYVLGNSTVTGTITGGTFTDGTFSATSGAFTGVASITDGTASWSSNSLSGFTSISGTTLTDGTASITTGSGTGFTSFTVDNLNLNGAIITSDTGAISFDNENLATTGTITSGLINAQTISSTANFTGSVAVTGAVTGATSYNGLVVTANTGVITTGTWQATDVGVEYGGTGASTLTGLLQGNGTSAITGITGTIGQFPYYNGTNTLAATSTLTILTSGNIGIGTTSPLSKLSVEGNSYVLGNSTVTGTSNFGGIITTNGNWISGDGGAEGISVNSAGNVGIGTTAPGAKLDVQKEQAGGVLRLSRLDNAVAVDDEWGSLEFYGTDTSTNGTNVHAKIVATSKSESTNDWGQLDFYTRNGATLGSKMTIQSAGNVGIGTTGPGAKFVVAGDTTLSGDNGQIRIQGATDSNRKLYLGVDTSAGTSYGYIQSTESTVNTRALSLQPSGGNVGIGTTAPTTKLRVHGSTQITGFSNPTTSAGLEMGYDGTQGIIQAYDRDASGGKALWLNYGIGNVIMGGNVGIGTTTPSTKLAVEGMVYSSTGGFKLPDGTIIDGVEDLGVIGADDIEESMLKAVNSPTDEYFLTYESTTGDFEWQTAGTEFDSIAGLNAIFSGESVASTTWAGATSLTTLGTIATGVWQATDIGVEYGGTGASTLTGLLQGNGTSAVTGITGTTGQFPYYNGTNTLAATSAIFISGSNIGIGTTSPASSLDVAGTGITLGGVTRTTWPIGAGSGAFQDATTYAYYTGGNVGIGTTTVGARLTIADTYSQMKLMYDTDNYVDIGVDSTGSFALTPSSINATTTIGSGDEALRIDSSGNVGIGTTAPVQELDITGDINLQNTTSNDTGVIYKNNSRFIHNFQDATGGGAVPSGSNTFVGIDSGNFTMGSTATQIWHGSYNSALGEGTLTANTTGYYNSAIGYTSQASNTTGYSNASVGALALYSNTEGYYNSALGHGSAYSNTTGNQNTAVGGFALETNTTGSSNTAIGYDAGRYIADGETDNLTGDFNVFLGESTKPLADNDQNEIVIGYNATGLGSNTAVLGNDSITKTILKGNVGIGTTSPSYKLSVNSTSASENLFQIATTTNQNILLVDNDGRVGIGTSTLSNYNLTVHGSLYADDIYTSGSTFYMGGNALLSRTGTVLDFGVETGESIDFTINDTSAMNIATGGNVGIGTTAPTQMLQVGNWNSGGTASDGQIVLAKSAVNTGNRAFKIGLDDNYSLSFGDYGSAGAASYSPAMVIKYDTGNVGIGTTAPVQLLHLEKSGADVATLYRTTGEFSWHTGIDNSNSNAFSIGSSATVGTNAVITATTGGNVGIGTTAPKSKLDIEGGLAVGATYSGTSVAPTNGAIIEGNVGIGTTAPSEQLTLYKTDLTGVAPATILLQNNANGTWTSEGFFGQILFKNADASGGLVGGIKSVIEGTAGEDAGLAFYTTNNGTTGFAERVRIDNDGNVGIGTTAPVANLHIYEATTDTALQIQRADNTGNGIIKISTGVTDDWILGERNSPVSSDFKLYSYGTATDVLTVLRSNGNVGIGTTAPVGVLEIKGPDINYPTGGRTPTVRFRQFSTPDYGWEWIHDDDVNGDLHFHRVENDVSTQVMSFDRGTGNIGIGTTAPDSSLHLYKSSGDTQMHLQAVASGDPTLKMTSANDRDGIIDYTDGTTLARFVYDHGDTRFNFMAHNQSAVDAFISETTNYFAGNVGIGTTGPEGKLNVFVASAGTVTPHSTGDDFIIEGGGSTDTGMSFITPDDKAGRILWTSPSTTADIGARIMYQQSTNLMTIGPGGGSLYLSGGNVGIGTTAPSAPLEVKGDIVQNNQGSTASFSQYYDKSTYPNLYNLIRQQGAGGMLIKAYGNSSSWDSITFSNDGGDRMIISPSGNVGIGTTAPGASPPNGSSATLPKWLEIMSAGTPYDTGILLRRIDSVTGLDLWTDAGTGDSFIDNYYNSDNGDIYFRTKTSGTPINAVVISGSGNVGIGTTSPGAKLSVIGTSIFDGAMYWTSGDAATDDWHVQYANGGLRFTEDGVSDERLFLKDGGNVGIGTTAPNAQLELNGTSALIRLHYPAMDTGTVGIEFQHRTANDVPPKTAILSTGVDSWGRSELAFVVDSNGDAGQYSAAADTKMIIKNNGNVGIGTASPGRLLSLNGGSSADPVLRLGSSSDLYYWDMGRENASTGRLMFINNNNGTIAERMSILYNGNVGIGTTAPAYQLQLSTDSAAKPGTTTWTVPSDERLKDVNGDFTRGLTALSGLYPSYFNYKDDNALDIPSDREYVGLIAQDVQAVIPEAVKEGQDGYLSVESDPIFWTMLNAIKELALKVGSDNITYTRDTLQVLNDTDAPQMKLAYDLENLAEFKVSAVGDLSISSAGKDIRLPDDNMLVCSSGACPILTSPFLGVQPPQGNAVQNFEKLTSGTGNLIVENVAFIAGVMGIGTPAPSRILDVYETGENPQMRVSYDESNFAEMQVNAVGDLLLSSAGKDVRLPDDNMLVCSGGACPTLTSPFLGVQPPQGNAVQNFEKLTSGTGNLIVENVAYIAGALGIGTPAPSRILDVYEPQSDPQFRISYDEDLYSEFNVSATGDLTISAAGGDISVLNENLRVCSDDGCPSIANEIASSGNIVVENSLLALGRVGIGGTISPDYTLDVHGTLRAYGITDASDARLKTNIRSLSKGSFPYEEPTLPAGRLATEGVRPLGQTSPTLQNIQKLRGVKFEWKNSEFGTGDQIGMIAQEMEQVYPELVSTDNDGYKSVQYGKFTAILLEAVKDLINFGETIEYRSARLEDRTVELEKKNRELENRIKALENILRQ